MTEGQVLLPPDEFVLRRIHKNQADAGPPVVISFLGFRPTRQDTEGLSVYREKLLSGAQVAPGGRRPGEYYVVRLLVRDLHSLGLSVVADEQTEGPAGHAIIPELSLDACKRDKARLREIQVRLAELATRDIVHYPDA